MLASWGLGLVLACTSTPQPAAPPSLAGAWQASLASPGGPLPFGLDLGEGSATIVNGPERIEVPAEIDGDRLTIRMDHYDAQIEATRAPDGVLRGTWRKQKSKKVDTLPFEAKPGSGPRFVATDAPQVDVSGRWAVDFSSSEDPAVALFAGDPEGVVHGTFLTPLGDYRYVAGRMSGPRLRLSVFDGSHAFLFHATLQADGTLAGDFWSGSAWHESWTAAPDAAADLPDAFGLTQWNGAAPLDALSFPDLGGTPRRLSDPAFAGKARILQVFGSWCPNCVDETVFLAELYETYGPRGLSILGLAFEYTPDVRRSIRQVRRFQERHGATWPVLIAGTADKTEASQRLPILDRVRAYPTTVFLHEDGRVRAVHTGICGAGGPRGTCGGAGGVCGDCRRATWRRGYRRGAVTPTPMRPPSCGVPAKWLPEAPRRGAR